MRREKSQIDQICTKFNSLELERSKAAEKALEERRLAADRKAEQEQEAAEIRSGLKDVFSATRLNHTTAGPSGANTCQWEGPKATFESCQNAAKEQRAKHEAAAAAKKVDENSPQQ